MLRQVLDHARHPLYIYLSLMFAKINYVRSVLMDGWSLSSSLLIELPVFLLMFGLLEIVLHDRNRLREVVYFSCNSLFSFVMFAIILYYQYFGGLVTYTSLFELNQAGEVGDSIKSLIKPQYWLLFIDLPLLAIWHGFRFGKLRHTTFKLRIRSKIGVMLLVAAFSLSVWNAWTSLGSTVNELKRAEGMGLLTYQAYAVYSDVKRQLLPSEAVSMNEVRKIKQIKKQKNPQLEGIAKDSDVIVVQLESVQAFLIGLKVDGREVTPNLNRLLKESYYFDRFFQQIARGNTSDAEFVTNTSIYPSHVQSTAKQVAGLVVPSLPRMLQSQGYEAITLHTNDVQFWSRNTMYPALGFDRYYDKAYFGEEDIVEFGASDEVLYEKSVDALLEYKQQGKKIYANLIAMSSHNPFMLPEDKDPMPIPAHLEGTLLGHYIQSCNYADRAFGQLIERMKEEGLWDNTLLVVYGDHFGFPDSAPEAELQAAADLLDIPAYTKAQMFNIPLIIRVPGQEEGEVLHQVGSKLDTLPTVANLLGLSLDDYVIFGQDLFNYEHNLIAQRVYLPTGSFINDEVMFIPGKGFDDGTFIPLDPSKEVSNTEQYRADFDRVLRLLELSDAYLNSLPSVNDELY